MRPPRSPSASDSLLRRGRRGGALRQRRARRPGRRRRGRPAPATHREPDSAPRGAPPRRPLTAVALPAASRRADRRAPPVGADGPARPQPDAGPGALAALRSDLARRRRSCDALADNVPLPPVAAGRPAPGRARRGRRRPSAASRIARAPPTSGRSSRGEGGGAARREADGRAHHRGGPRRRGDPGLGLGEPRSAPARIPRSRSPPPTCSPGTSTSTRTCAPGDRLKRRWCEKVHADGKLLRYGDVLAAALRRERRPGDRSGSSATPTRRATRATTTTGRPAARRGFLSSPLQLRAPHLGLRLAVPPGAGLREGAPGRRLRAPRPVRRCGRSATGPWRRRAGTGRCGKSVTLRHRNGLDTRVLPPLAVRCAPGPRRPEAGHRRASARPGRRPGPHLHYAAAARRARS